jgi:hypothetical protein
MSIEEIVMLARILFRPLFALAIGTASVVSSTAEARTWVGVSVGIAPPPLRIERVVLRPGYVWAAGYWRWNGARHVWVGGRRLPARAGYRYAGPAWVHARDGWAFRRGHWVRL